MALGQAPRSENRNEEIDPGCSIGGDPPAYTEGRNVERYPALHYIAVHAIACFLGKLRVSGVSRQRAAVRGLALFWHLLIWG